MRILPAHFPFAKQSLPNRSPSASMQNPGTKRFRHTAGFGKRVEYWIIGRMLKEGLDVYVPLVDDNAVDAIVRRADGSIALIQIKARSADVIPGDAALFAAIPHELRDGYWFVFYAERLDQMWIMTSEEFIAESDQNKTGKNAGRRTIWFNGKRKDKENGGYKEYCRPRFEKYLANDFARIAERAEYPANPSVATPLPAPPGRPT
jgi:hypothetical protein